MPNLDKQKADRAWGRQEKEILQYAAQGLLDKDIALALHLGVPTIRGHWDRISEKLDIAHEARAAALGIPQLEIENAGDELAASISPPLDNDVIVICDAGGVFLTWNKSVEQIFGYPASEWIGRNHSMIYLAGEKYRANQALAEAGLIGIGVVDRWHLRKDSSRFWGANIIIAFEPPNSLGAYAKIVRPKSLDDLRTQSMGTSGLHRDPGSTRAGGQLEVHVGINKQFMLMALDQKIQEIERTVISETHEMRRDTLLNAVDTLTSTVIAVREARSDADFTSMHDRVTGYATKVLASLV